MLPFMWCHFFLKDATFVKVYTWLYVQRGPLGGAGDLNDDGVQGVDEGGASCHLSHCLQLNFLSIKHMHSVSHRKWCLQTPLPLSLPSSSVSPDSLLSAETGASPFLPACLNRKGLWFSMGKEN